MTNVTPSAARRGAWAALAFVVLCLGCNGSDDESASDGPRLETIAGGTVGDGRPAREVALGANTVAVDDRGNIYLSDHDRVRRIDARTGRISSLAGGETRRQCRLIGPPGTTCLGTTLGVAVDPLGHVFATDHLSGAVLRIDPNTHAQTVVATATLPLAIAVDGSGNVFFTDEDEGYVFRIDARTGAVTPFAGDGDPSAYSEQCPLDVPALGTCIGRSPRLAIDREGGVILSAGDIFPTLRRVDPETGIISALPVPDGPVAVDRDGTLLVSLWSTDRIIRYDPAIGTTTIVRQGGNNERLLPMAIAVAPNGRILLLTGHLRLLEVDPVTGALTVVAGSGLIDACGDGGPARDACLASPVDADVAPNGDIMLAEAWGHIRTIDAQSGTISTIADLQRADAGGCFQPSGLATTPTGDVFVASYRSSVCHIDRATGTMTLVVGGSCDGYDEPGAAEGEPAVGACVFVADLMADTDGALLIADNYRPRLWRVDPVSGRFELVAGNGSGGFCGDGGDARAACVRPTRLARDAQGNLFVLDDSDDVGAGTRVRMIDAATGIITTVAGRGVPEPCEDGGSALAACFYAHSLVADGAGGLLLGDYFGIRRIDLATGTITKVFGLPDESCPSCPANPGDFRLAAIDARDRALLYTVNGTPTLQRLTLPPAD